MANEGPRGGGVQLHSGKPMATSSFTKQSSSLPISDQAAKIASNPTSDLVSGSIVRTENLIGDPSERIQSFVWEKFNVQDIRDLELRPDDSESEEDEETPQSIRGRKLDELYDVISVVGAGAFGIVIACRDRKSNKKFALKIAAQDHPHAAASLRREKQMLAGMSHPNIIRVYETQQDYKNLVIMKMELGKESISSFLERYQQRTGQMGLPEEVCAKIMKGLFRALNYLHEEPNIIHRDIKPDNIILGSHKDLTRVKLLDFGLAVQNSLHTITDFAKCGTFLYKPPEQVTNIFAYAKKADVWASGIIMFYLLTGRHPIWKEGITKLQMEQMMKKFKGFEYPKSMSPQAQHLISCLCQKNQTARYRPVNALQHPFVTRKLDAELPLSDLDRRALAIKNQPIEDKLRKAMRVLFVCGLSRQGSRSPNNAGQPPQSQAKGTSQAVLVRTNGEKGGGCSSSTTQEETQQSSSSLHGQQLENYKQMIKSFEAESSNTDDDVEKNQSDDERNSSCRSGSQSTGRTPGADRANASFSDLVAAVSAPPGSAARRETTPKNNQRQRSLVGGAKRQTPKGRKQLLSQMGGAGDEQPSEKEEDFFKTKSDERHGHTTTQKSRKQGNAAHKKGKPPLISKGQAFHGAGISGQNQTSSLKHPKVEKLNSQAVEATQTFTGALDSIFARQRTAKIKRAGSSTSTKWKGEDETGRSDTSGNGARTDQERSFFKVSASKKRLRDNSNASEVSEQHRGSKTSLKQHGAASTGGGGNQYTRPVVGVNRKGVRVMTMSAQDRLSRGDSSKSSGHKTMRVDQTSSEDEKYTFDGSQSVNKRTSVPSQQASRNDNKTTTQSNAIHSSATTPVPSHHPATEQKPRKDLAMLASAKGSVPRSGGPSQDLSSSVKRHEQRELTEKAALRKRKMKTTRGSNLDLQAPSFAAGEAAGSEEDRSGLGGSHAKQSVDRLQNHSNMVGIGLLPKQKSPLNSLQAPIQASVALSDKYAAASTNQKVSSDLLQEAPDSHMGTPETSNNHTAGGSRKNLRQREILSSAESANHFITKTRVGGTLKNSRQVVAPNSEALPLTTTDRGLANQSEINDFAPITNQLNQPSEEKSTNQSVALNSRKQSKLRRDKFSSLKKQNQVMTMDPSAMMKLPGIKTGSKQGSAALYSAKQSVFEDSSLVVSHLATNHHQTSYNYSHPPSHHLKEQPQPLSATKGLTPKRRHGGGGGHLTKKQALTVKPLEVESHLSSMSQLSPATTTGHYNQQSVQAHHNKHNAGHHKSLQHHNHHYQQQSHEGVGLSQPIPKTSMQLDQTSKSIPPRSTQVAGTAIIQGVKAASVVKNVTNSAHRGTSMKHKQAHLYNNSNHLNATPKDRGATHHSIVHSSSKLGGQQASFAQPGPLVGHQVATLHQQSAATHDGASSILEGLLTSKQVKVMHNNSGSIGLSVTPLGKQIQATYPAMAANSTNRHEPNTATAVHRDSSVLGSSSTQHHTLRETRGHQMGACQGQVPPSEDFNDRLIDSPKTRSYVPLLSKKLHKSSNHHGSSENVLTQSQSSANGGGRPTRRGESGHRHPRQASQHGGRSRGKSKGGALDVNAQASLNVSSGGGGVTALGVHGNQTPFDQAERNPQVDPSGQRSFHTSSFNKSTITPQNHGQNSQPHSQSRFLHQLSSQSAPVSSETKTGGKATGGKFPQRQQH